MKIVLLSMNFAPELTGIGKYSGELADALIQRGHEVTVVCAPPYYPSWSASADYSYTNYTREQPRPGLTVWRCPVWLPKRLSGLKRLIHLASFALSSLPILLRLLAWRPGVVMVVAPALFSAPAGWMLARLCGASAWLHIQDFELDAAFELGLLRGALLRQVVTASERLLMRGFNVVSTISRQMVRKVAGKGVPLDRAELLPNWVDLRQIRPVDNAPALRTELGIDADECVCLFSGTINRKQGLDVLVQTARLLAHDPRIVIVICGNGELRPGLEAAAHGLSNIRFIDLRPAQELNTLLNMADMHLLPQLEGAADLVMPSKLTGMLASGRPVIAAAAEGTEIASVVEGLGMTIKPESAECFARAISELADDPKRRRELGAASRRYAEKALDADVLFDKLDQRLNMLGNTRHTPLVVNSRAGH